MKNKKVLVVGKNTSYGRAGSFFRTFKKLGFSCQVIEQDNYYQISFLNRVVNWILRYFNSLPVYWNVNAINELVLKRVEIQKPDLVLFIKPILMKPDTLQELKDKKIIIFSWHPDDMMNKSNSSRFFHESISLYDCHFTTKTFNVSEVLNKGAKKAKFLPHAVDTYLHHPVNVLEKEKNKIGADLVFVGTFAKDKRLEYTEKLCQMGYNIKIYGNRWNKVPNNYCIQKKDCIQDRPVYGEDFRKVMSSSKIALAFLRHENRDVQTSRTYEIPACRTFMIHERTEEAKKLFQEGQEAEFFETFEELKSKIDFYLKNKSKRKKIAQKGFQKAMTKPYLYESRVYEIIKIYNEITNNKN